MPICRTTGNELTAIPYFIQKKIPDRDLLTLLLERGVDVNHADNNGMTALHYTLKRGSAENAHYLIKKELTITGQIIRA